MLIREQLEENERKSLSPLAKLSSESRGRLVSEKECDLRPAFQHDRDRIIHSKAFRRLKHKTQVFLTPSGDHYRTRLTHTLEVSQIARTIAKSLLLNEDLTEAIALGHDLGHTPFGHAGEDVLNRIVPGGFRHPLLKDKNIRLTCGMCQKICFGNAKETRKNFELLVSSGCVLQNPAGEILVLPPEEAQKVFDEFPRKHRKLYIQRQKQN